MKKVLKSIYLDPETLACLDARAELLDIAVNTLIGLLIDAGLQQPAPVRPLDHDLPEPTYRCYVCEEKMTAGNGICARCIR